MVVVLVSITASLFVALGNHVSRYQAYCLMQRSRESQAHLDHAVKQKFAGVASALEQCLLTLRANDPTLDSDLTLNSPRGRGEESSSSSSSSTRGGEPTKNSTTAANSELIELLREAYVLTREQHDACHLLNLARRARPSSARQHQQQQQHHQQVRFETKKADDIVNDWGERMAFLGVKLEVDLSLDSSSSSSSPVKKKRSGEDAPRRENVAVEEEEEEEDGIALDWDLAYYLVFSLLHNYAVGSRREERRVRLVVRRELRASSIDSSSPSLTSSDDRNEEERMMEREALLVLKLEGFEENEGNGRQSGWKTSALARREVQW